MIWADLVVAAIIGLALPALWASAAGWWMPWGPLTAGEALWSLLISFTTGAAAGVMMRARWAIVAAPVTFLLVFEFVRRAADSPTADPVELSMFAVDTVTTGRGLHVVVSLVPMALGAAVGAGAARRMTAALPGSTAVSPEWPAGRVVAILTAIGLVALAVGLAWPA